MKKTATINSKKSPLKWLFCVVLAALLLIVSFPVHAIDEQSAQIETKTVAQDHGSRSVSNSMFPSQIKESFFNKTDVQERLKFVQTEEIAVAADWETEQPHEGVVLHGGYVGFKNKASGKFLTIPDGVTAVNTNVCQQSISSVANAQEFYLSYTYVPKKSCAYFTINPVDSAGSVMSVRVKAGTFDISDRANVSLQYFMPTEMTDRWQIEHVEGNYYLIHMSSSPYENGTRYVLVGTSGEGTNSGTLTYSPGNVYVAPLSVSDMPTQSMLWEICVDGEPVNINANNIELGTEQIVNIDEYLEYYYIPKSFDCTLNWHAQGSVTLTAPGAILTEDFGTGMVNVEIELHDESVIEETAYLRMMPIDGTLCYLENKASGKYLHIEGKSVASNSYLEQKDYSNDHDAFRWIIEHDPANPGYVRLKSVHSGLYMALKSSNITQIVQCQQDTVFTLWKINSSVQGNKYLVCKATEASQKVLAVPFPPNVDGANLINLTYVSDSNHTDEWVFHFSDVMLIAIKEDYNRSDYFPNILDNLESIGYTYNYQNHDNIDTPVTKDDLLAYMQESRIFVVRTHGSATAIGANQGDLDRTDLLSLPLNALQRSELIIYGACWTANQEAGDNLVDATIQRGARTVIGFEDPIPAYGCNYWCEKFFEYYAEYSLVEGKTLLDVCQKTDTYVKRNHYLSYKFTKDDGVLVTLENYRIAGETDFPE